MATALALVLMLAWPAAANDYGRFIEIETEEDLLDLLTAQEIDEGDYEALLELLTDGVDLNDADRDELYALPNLTYADADAILAYRDEAGHIDDPLSLVTAKVLDERKLLAIAPFLIVVEGEPALYATRGRFKYQTTYVAGDSQVPSMALYAKVSSLKNLDVGLWGVMTRNRLPEVAYDPNRDALAAHDPTVQLQVPKFYVQWKTKAFHAVAGTYRIGFGQRLTFDNSTWYSPNGIKADETISYSQDLTRACKESDGESSATCQAARDYRSPDYRWTDRLRGVALGMRHLELGDGWLQAYGWFSYQTHSIYQYEIFNRRWCDDPLDDDSEDNINCSAPAVYRRQSDPLAATSRFSYQSLPNMYNELLGGANVSYFFDRRFHIGLTGYGADVSWLVQGMDLDFQEWSSRPYGGPYGAVGLDLAWGADRLDLFLELARTFDSQPAGGGFAALMRTTVTWKKHEFEAALRYYDRDFANPYARPISAADEYDGLRARDEAGLRLRYSGRVGDLHLRATNDFWAQLSDEAPKLQFKFRADYDLETWVQPGVWFEYQDKDLSESGHDGMCYETPFESFEGEPVPCGGAKLQTGVQARFEPMRDLAVTVKYQHRWMDDRWTQGGGDDVFADSFRQDAAGWLIVMYKPSSDWRIRARVRYLFEDIENNDHLEQSVWGYLEAQYWFKRDFKAKLRYEAFAWLDDRASTTGCDPGGDPDPDCKDDARSPNPAHWIRLELEYRF